MAYGARGQASQFLLESRVATPHPVPPGRRSFGLLRRAFFPSPGTFFQSALEEASADRARRCEIFCLLGLRSRLVVKI
jgi:hypothetical protein